MKRAPAYQDLDLNSVTLGKANDSNSKCTFVPLDITFNMRTQVFYELSDYEGNEKFKTTLALTEHQAQVMNAIHAKVSNAMYTQHLPILTARLKTETAARALEIPLVKESKGALNAHLMNANVFIKTEQLADGSIKRTAPFTTFQDVKTKQVIGPFEALQRGADGIARFTIKDVCVGSAMWCVRVYLNEFIVLQPGSSGPSTQIDIEPGKYGDDVEQLLQAEAHAASETVISNSELRVFLELVKHAGPSMLKQICAELNIPDAESKIADRVPEWQVPSCQVPSCQDQAVANGGYISD